MPFLKIDAQFSVIEAALKGCLKWLTSTTHSGIVSSPESKTQKRSNLPKERKQDVMLSNLEVWCDRLIKIPFEACRQFIPQLYFADDRRTP